MMHFSRVSPASVLSEPRPCAWCGACAFVAMSVAHVMRVCNVGVYFAAQNSGNRLLRHVVCNSGDKVIFFGVVVAVGEFSVCFWVDLDQDFEASSPHLNFVSSKKTRQLRRMRVKRYE